MIEDENTKQAHTSTGGPLKSKSILIGKNDKQVRTSTRYSLKKKDMFRDKKENRCIFTLI